MQLRPDDCTGRWQARLSLMRYNAWCRSTSGWLEVQMELSKSVIRISLLAAVVFIAGAFPAWAAGPAHTTCVNCHTRGGAPSASNLISQPSGLCIECHSQRHGSSEHVVDVPTTYPQLILPLQDGLMTCSTCHDAHSSVVAMLRLPTNQLCITCHEK